MNPLQELAAALGASLERGMRPVSGGNGIDDALAALYARERQRRPVAVADDRLRETLARFWDSVIVADYRDAYLLSWGLCLPVRPQGPCVVEDRLRLEVVLDGVDRQAPTPRAYRRCFRGLAAGYFTFDPLAAGVEGAARNNWKLLRDYLHANVARLDGGEAVVPDWAALAQRHRALFGEHPCEPFAGSMLRGDTAEVDAVCEQLGISKASWFQRELVLAQVEGAVGLDDAAFRALLPHLLALLARNTVLRDRGFARLLDRYAESATPIPHRDLQACAVEWWGNPWLPSNQMQWGAVTRKARELVAEWLKLEFIDDFFTKLAQDGYGDQRRTGFWKRYVKAIDHIEFALGSAARGSRDEDLLALRRKMKGLIVQFDSAGARNNAFIMTIGDLVAVEFSDTGALYGYDRRSGLPFDTRMPVLDRVDAPNSLKHKGSRKFWLKHRDGVRGYDFWEDRFEAAFREEFGIVPGVRSVAARSFTLDTSGRTVAYGSSPAGQHRVVREYDRAALDAFAAERGLRIDDRTAVGGRLWVIAGFEADLVRTLRPWGFNYAAGKGWWREKR